MGIPLVLRPKTLPMAMFQPKCQPSVKPKRPPVKSTLRPPARPPRKMLIMLFNSVPPGDCRCITTKNADSTTKATRKAVVGASPRCECTASARLYSIQPLTGSSSFRATFKWKTTSYKMQRAKLSDISKTSKNLKKWIQPSWSSTTNMKATIVMPTTIPTKASLQKGASKVSPKSAKLRLSIHLQVHQTVKTEPSVMPKRMQASLKRRLPVTWFRKKGWPLRSASRRSSSDNRSFGGHTMLGSFSARSSGVISAPKGRLSPQSRRASCSIQRMQNSLATAWATTKKKSRAQMLIFWSTSERKAPLASRVWPMLKTAKTAKPRSPSKKAPGAARAVAALLGRFSFSFFFSCPQPCPRPMGRALC
mmetsp:Transcript_69367/g.176185  ORF Transcript_69367/g.176185 Transcript_69367/m.176185 type:complete len:363 (+) Transcript_69367:348-1436(+)